MVKKLYENRNKDIDTTTEHIEHGKVDKSLSQSIYIYIYIFIFIKYIYILESRSLRSRILALRWRCGVGRRTARMSDAAVLLTKKYSKWSNQIQNFKTCITYIESLIYKIL